VADLTAQQLGKDIDDVTRVNKENKKGGDRACKGGRGLSTALSRDGSTMVARAAAPPGWPHKALAMSACSDSPVGNGSKSGPTSEGEIRMVARMENSLARWWPARPTATSWLPVLLVTEAGEAGGAA